MIGLITLDEKCAGARSAGNPHAACEAEGTGNGVTDQPRRARRGKPRRQTRMILRATAPVLDPTAPESRWTSSADDGSTKEAPNSADAGSRPNETR